MSRDTEEISREIEKLCSLIAPNNNNLSSQLIKRAFEHIATSVVPINYNENLLLNSNYFTGKDAKAANDALTSLYIHLKRNNAGVKPTNILKFMMHHGQKNKVDLRSIDRPRQIINSTLRSNCERNYNTLTFNSSSGVSVNGSKITDSKTDSLTHNQVRKNTKSTTTSMQDVNERALIQDVLYAIQGVETQYLRMAYSKNECKIVDHLKITPNQRQSACQLAKIGFLHSEITRFCDNTNDKAGVVTKTLVCAFREELREFYKLIALIKEQSQTEEGNDPVSLRKMTLWMIEPCVRLKWLCAMVEAVSNKKGAQIITIIHGFSYCGSETVQKLVYNILGRINRPLLNVLSSWMFQGHLIDPYGEFFIESCANVSIDRLWYDKYLLRPGMVPPFLEMSDAEKILATGKSINFLREVCQESSPPVPESLKQLFEASNNLPFYNETTHALLMEGVDQAYKQTSRHVLDVLLTNYKLLQHLNAIKKYLLFGQGDFFQQLINLVVPEMNTPSKFDEYNLSFILESAIRLTTAQYEDKDCIKRLDILAKSKNSQWDEFTLEYKTHGPIGTVLEPHKDSHTFIFKSLWNLKRRQYILTSVWDNQLEWIDKFKNIGGMSKVMNQLSFCTGEMIHLVNQMQYYIMFEVIECRWQELTKSISVSTTLDDVIRAYTQFINDVKVGALLDNASKDLSVQLHVILKFILNLEEIEREIFKLADTELARQTKYDDAMKLNAYGTDDAKENQRKMENDLFVKKLNHARDRLCLLKQQYRSTVCKFLQMLATNSEVRLQLLSFRLDSNGFYKRLIKRGLVY